jgi:pimeloyl-ACP methyl ester carboxylesterase
MELQVQGRTAYAYTGGKPFDATLPAVVFIHGALHDHSAWTLLSRWCAHHGHAVLALDLPGHGRSAGPPLPSVEAIADWVLALLDAAGAKRATLVGHSMGSLIALEAAARAPDRVAGLVMLGTAYPMKVSAALLDTALNEPLKAIDMVNAWSFCSTAAKPSFPGPGMWLHGSNRALMRRMQAGETSLNLFHHEFSLCDGYRGGEAAAAKVGCPVTFVLGRQDMMTPARAARDFAATLKAKVVTVEAGHNMVAEVPDAVLAELRTSLSLSGRGQG